MLSSIARSPLSFPPRLCVKIHDSSLRMRACITIHRYATLSTLTETAPKATPWIDAINRLLKAELRLDPRPKPGRDPKPKYWNFQDLAAAGNIRTTTLSDWMTGKRVPSIGNLQAIAAALNVPVAALLMGGDEAAAYVAFQQSRDSAAQTTESVEQAVRRVLDAEGERLKEEWIALQTQRVLDATKRPA